MSGSGYPEIAFIGTPVESAVVLEALCEAGVVVDLVVTAEDKRRGRGSAVSPSPVKAAATRRGLRVSHRLEDVEKSTAAVGVVVAYGHIVPAHLLDVTPMVNVHFSLLPRWRGAAPVERAILAGDETTGVCIMEVEEGLDTGGVFARVEIPVLDKTAAQLRSELSSLGADLLASTLDGGLGLPVPQDGVVTYARKLTTDDRRISRESSPIEVDRIVRVGGAWTMLAGRRLKVSEVTRDRSKPGAFWVSCGDGEIGLVAVQPEGKTTMGAPEWARGARISEGAELGS